MKNFLVYVLVLQLGVVVTPASDRCIPVSSGLGVPSTYCWCNEAPDIPGMVKSYPYLRTKKWNGKEVSISATINEDFGAMYSCNSGLGPVFNATCRHDHTWDLPEETTTFKCDTGAFKATEMDSMEDICTRVGGMHLAPNDKCIVVPKKYIEGSERYSTCDDIAAEIGLPSVKSRPLLLNSPEEYAFFAKNVTKILRKEVLSVAYYPVSGPPHNFTVKIPALGPYVSTEEWWTNGDRYYDPRCPDSEECPPFAGMYFRGPGNHSEPVDWLPSDEYRDYWTGAEAPYWLNAIPPKDDTACLAHGFVRHRGHESVVFDECDRKHSGGYRHHPVACELIVWPNVCTPHLTSNVVKAADDSAVPSKMNANDVLSVKCKNVGKVLTVNGVRQTTASVAVVCNYAITGLTITNDHVDCTTEHLVDSGCQKMVPKECVSPFSYKGEVYSGCTNVDREDGHCWCATAGKFDGGWKHC